MTWSVSLDSDVEERGGGEEGAHCVLAARYVIHHIVAEGVVGEHMRVLKKSQVLGCGQDAVGDVM